MSGRWNGDDSGFFLKTGLFILFFDLICARVLRKASVLIASILTLLTPSSRSGTATHLRFFKHATKCLPLDACMMQGEEFTLLPFCVAAKATTRWNALNDSPGKMGAMSAG
jgi:hypothetical protein